MSEHQRHLVDPYVLSVLSDVVEVIAVVPQGESAWAKATRIITRQPDGNEVSYFMKVSVGDKGFDALRGEFESTSAIYAIVPDFCPKPIAYGTFQSDPNSHFYICGFRDLNEGVPEPILFCEKLARLHANHSSPEGKFGFHCTTYNGNVPQDNAWSSSWEVFFAKGFRHVLKIREERAGPNAELDALLPILFEKIIPRLLRPLESNGRTVKPSLVHGDLWWGNTSIIDENTKEGIIYDPSSFWAHNECKFCSIDHELGNWRPARNKFTRRYFQAYHSHMPKAEPEEDYDDRNALYAMRFNLHAAVMFSDQKAYLQMVVDEIRRLGTRYPEVLVIPTIQDEVSNETRPGRRPGCRGRDGIFRCSNCAAFEEPGL